MTGGATRVRPVLGASWICSDSSSARAGMLEGGVGSRVEGTGVGSRSGKGVGTRPGEGEDEIGVGRASSKSMPEGSGMWPCCEPAKSIGSSPALGASAVSSTATLGVSAVSSSGSLKEAAGVARRAGAGGGGRSIATGAAGAASSSARSGSRSLGAGVGTRACLAGVARAGSALAARAGTGVCSGLSRPGRGSASSCDGVATGCRSRRGTGLGEGRGAGVCVGCITGMGVARRAPGSGTSLPRGDGVAVSPRRAPGRGIPARSGCGVEDLST